VGRNAGGAGSLLGVAAGARGDPQTLRSLYHFAPEAISYTNFSAAVRRGPDDLRQCDEVRDLRPRALPRPRAELERLEARLHRRPRPEGPPPHHPRTQNRHAPRRDPQGQGLLRAARLRGRILREYERGDSSGGGSTTSRPSGRDRSATRRPPRGSQRGCCSSSTGSTRTPHGCWCAVFCSCL